MARSMQIAKKWLAAMNERDVGKMNSLCWEDAVAHIFNVEDGKIRRIIEYYDGAAVATQMGLP